MTPAEEANIEEVDAWAYRNGGEENPMTCGTVCGELWSAEKGVPKSSTAFWNELAELMFPTGMWGTLELGGTFHLGKEEYYTAILVEGAAPKWIWVPVPREALEPPGVCAQGHWGHLRAIGEKWSPSSSEYPAPSFKTDDWVISAYPCGVGGEGIVQWDPEAGEGSCKAVGGPFPIPASGNGWSEERWRWSTCYQLNKESKYEATGSWAEGLYRPFTTAKVEARESQTSESVFKTKAGIAPGKTALQKEVEEALEHDEVLGPWVNWVLEGKHGPAPGSGGSAAEGYGGDGGGPSPGGPPRCTDHSHAVNCATGNESISQVDLSVGGRGPGLTLTRTYNSQAAVSASSHGPFGYGWSAPYGASTEEPATYYRTVTTDEGSVLRFIFVENHWVSVSPLIQATLSAEGSEYILTYPDQTKYTFASSGLLKSITDRNGNTITMHRSGEGRLESVTDEKSRAITFSYNGAGEISEAKDPLGHTVKYKYDEAGNLEKVTEPGEESANWTFKYDGSHQMTLETDGRGNSIERTYDGSHRVSTETDALSRKRSWEYSGTYGQEPTTTTITEPNGSTTVEQFNAHGELLFITRAYGTSEATTSTYAYNSVGELESASNGRGYPTTYTYDANRNKTSETDSLGRKTQWTYNSTHDVISTTTPAGETTTIKRDEHGNVETVERPAPGETTQKTKYKYTAHGQLEQLEDPLKNAWKYGYDAAGDRTSETDPEGDKRTWEYDEDSNVIASVSPRGNVEGAEAAKYTTSIERDAQERSKKITDPLGHTTKYVYDKAGNLEKLTDANSHTTTYAYDADNEPTKVEQANGDTTETGYDSEGHVETQTDGNKDTTKYTRNKLGEVTEEEDPLKRKAKKSYDAAGNLTKLVDAKERTTTYKYDAANQLSEVEYSEGGNPAVEYQYNADGDRIKMHDGTGTSNYTYDQLDRLTETKDSHGDVVKYEYNLANENTKITYPNTKTVTRKYDKAGRLEKVEDWLEHTTSFSYDPDSDLTKSAFPNNEDKYSYNEADQQTKTEMKKGAETLASLTYTPDNLGQLEKVVQTGLPGAEETKYSYDENNRLTKDGSSEYKYDAADNPTTTPGSSNTYDAASQLEKGTNVEYTYNELGERTKRKPSSGPATTYGYDQAGDLTKVERPKEGETSEIKDSYTYDGNSLRASQTISGTTTYMSWDPAQGLPLLLNDGTNNYIYGPEGTPIEQINGEGTVQYLHHDQAGSIRLLTNSSGTVDGKCTYSAYGTPTCEGTASTPLGYDGQYTSTDTGLVYLRARTYDPATGQFMSRDPLESITGEPYGYVADDPPNASDPAGLAPIAIPAPVAAGCAAAPEVCAAAGLAGGLVGADAYLGVKAVNAWTGDEGGDEGESEIRRKQAELEGHCGSLGTPNPGNLEKVSDREIKEILDEAGTDPHTDKAETVGGEAGAYDYYRDKTTGEIYLVPKDGGEPIPTGLGG
ncbi:MAG TPA: RHS repeat-associated core domain-containing protein [Solirubrobacteraceae bacterium]|nr:RHS repeat-associated core domain-containing protein [Solirubrobacteraceae bacterium]